MPGCRALPLAWLVTVTTVAAWQKIFSDDARIGFFAAAQDMAEKLAAGALPPERAAVAPKLIFNQQLDGWLTVVLLIVVWTIVIDMARGCWPAPFRPAAGPQHGGALRGDAAHMNALARRWRRIWSGLRALTGDDAYERYAEHCAPPPSRRNAARPRCVLPGGARPSLGAGQSLLLDRCD